MSVSTLGWLNKLTLRGAFWEEGAADFVLQGNKMAKGYWMVHVTVTDPENYAEYVRLDTPVVERFGGTFLVRGGQNETPEAPQKDRHVIVEFPSYQAALDCYHSDDYQAAAKIRLANSDSDIVVIEGT